MLFYLDSGFHWGKKKNGQIPRQKFSKANEVYEPFLKLKISLTNFIYPMWQCGREREGGHVQRDNTKGRVCAVITHTYSQVKVIKEVTMEAHQKLSDFCLVTQSVLLQSAFSL
jgi:hypothetical protein